MSRGWSTPRSFDSCSLARGSHNFTTLTPPLPLRSDLPPCSKEALPCQNTMPDTMRERRTNVVDQGTTRRMQEAMCMHTGQRDCGKTRAETRDTIGSTKDLATRLGLGLGIRLGLGLNPNPNRCYLLR